MVDSGSMSCSLNEAAAAKLLQHYSEIRKSAADDIVVIGVGGHHVTLTAVYDLEMTVYGFKLLVPTLVIPGQADDMILGRNQEAYTADERLTWILEAHDNTS